MITARALWLAYLVFRVVLALPFPVDGARADEALSTHGLAPLRVGLVSYSDEGDAQRRLGALLRDVADRLPGSRFEISSGTYGDMLHWLERGEIDLALVTPALLVRAESGALGTRWDLLGLHAAERTGTSVGVVRTDSPLRTVGDLRTAFRRGAARVLFVHPLSVSGAVAPQVALAGEGVVIPPRAIRYTHSHTSSIRALSDPAASDTIAFVWDGSLPNPLPPELRVLDLPALAKIAIPPDALVARSDLPRLPELRSLIASGAVPALSPLQPGRTHDGTLTRALADAGRLAADRLDRLDLEELGSMLAHYARTSTVPLRLAVVFSGGGAKCSFQVGAIRALEKKLAELRESTANPALDISLVVGTSGGAINALPVALGLSKDMELQRKFESVWRSLDQREIIRPSPAVRSNMAAWFAALQLFMFLWLRARGILRSSARRIGIVIALLGVFELLLPSLTSDPWSLLGPRQALHRLWLWLQLGLPGAGAILVAAGAGLILRGDRYDAGDERSGRLTRSALVLAMVALPLLQAFTIFSYEPTLSEGSGIERSLAEKFAELLDAKRVHNGRTPGSRDGQAGVRERIRAMSREIIGDGLLERDLVLTGSLLGERGLSLPPDLYFFASANRTTELPQFGMKAVSLNERPDLLLDALIGSGAIYPVFPARTLEDFPSRGQRVEIVDGSFAHRSPLEAAVLWGATHIILIQADSEDIVPRGAFAANIAAALNHLYDQAQLTDVRTIGDATIFTLAPLPPHIGLLDFAGTLIDYGIKKGAREAMGPEGDRGGYRKEPGRPRFVPIDSLG